MRGDTDFSLTSEFDRWHLSGVRFVFGYDAKAKLIGIAEGQNEDLYHCLVKRAEHAMATKPRRKAPGVKETVVRPEFGATSRLARLRELLTCAGCGESHDSEDGCRGDIIHEP